MKITKAPTEFTPVTITFETEEEFLVFKNLTFYTETVPGCIYQSNTPQYNSLKAFLRKAFKLCAEVSN